MRRKQCPRSSNTAITFEKSSIPRLQQGACLAREVGEVGGETSGTARVGAGFAPNKYTPAAKRRYFPGRGYGGSMHPCLHHLFHGTKLAYELVSPSFPKSFAS